jgi:hypothetical protein
MRLRTQKLALSATTGGCLLATAGIVTWGLQSTALSPPENRDVNAHSSSVADSTDERSPTPTREAFAQLCERPLRRPLYDPPPPKPVVKQLPPLRVELLGTIIDGDNSMAIVRSEQGKVEYRRKGESVGPSESPALLVEIQSNAVLLERDQERITLKVQGSERR